MAKNQYRETTTDSNDLSDLSFSKLSLYEI